LAFAKRPAEELYDARKDPGQLENLAGKQEHADAQKKLREQLDRWMAETGDPRATGETDFWDKCPYVGSRKKPATESRKTDRPIPKRKAESGKRKPK